MRGCDQARTAGVADLWATSLACSDTLAGRRDQALLLIGFATAARCSNLSALLVHDLRSDSAGLAVTVRVGKTTEEAAVRCGEHRELGQASELTGIHLALAVNAVITFVSILFVWFRSPAHAG